MYSDSIRGTYVIFPLKYESSLNLTELAIDGAENADFSSYDMSDILARRCRKENGFVRRYILIHALMMYIFQMVKYWQLMRASYMYLTTK